MKRNILIAGASGFLGSRVAAILKNQNCHITAFARNISEAGHVGHSVDRFIQGDLSLESSINSLVEETGTGTSEALFLAGSVDYHQEYESAYISNVKTAENFTRILGHLNGKSSIRRCLFVGSVASHGFLSHEPSEDEYIKEETDYYREGLSIYADIKREAVTRVTELSGELSLNPVILEPGSLVGGGKGNRSTTNTGLIRKILKGMPVLSGGASYTSAERAAEGIVSALTRGKPGNRYLLGGENMRMKDFARLVRRIAFEEHSFRVRGRIPLFTLPSGISRLMGRAGIVMNSQQALLGNSFHYINSGKARDELGYTHSPDDLRFAIKETLDGVLS
jgi:dihydroflavonol-4-reductase